MKRKCSGTILVILAVFMMFACGNKADSREKNATAVLSPPEETRQNIEETNEKTEKAEDTPEEIPEGAIEESIGGSPEGVAKSDEETGGAQAQMQEMMIEVGGQSFQTTLYDNETVRALQGMLPMTLSMDELHGNEKFYYLEEGLPMDSENVGSIQTGDIMLFGSDCLVLFFEDFSTSYSYTKIGHIEDSEAFADALKSGTVDVTFETKE